jgi:hypothetical protein
MNFDFSDADSSHNQAYQIFSISQIDITILARNNKSDIKQHNIKTPFFGFKCLSIFKSLEVLVFNFFAKKEILKHDTIHFFTYSDLLVEFAKKNNKKIILEADDNSINNYYNYDIKECYKLADIIISHSNNQTNTLKSYIKDENKIVQIIDNPQKVLELYS